MNWSIVKFHLGKIANLFGFPAVVRECDYHSRTLGAFVTVKKLELYTVVTVNGVDVYFNRLSGSIDGVGSSQGACCTMGEVPESERPALGRAVTPERVDRRTA
jgi:hypothetical protein